MLQLTALFDIFSVALIIPILNIVSNFESFLSQPYFISYKNFFVNLSKTEVLLIVLSIFVGINILKSFYYAYTNYKILVFAKKINQYLSANLVNKYLSETYTYLTNKKNSTLVRNLTEEIERVQYSVSNLLSLFAEIIISFLLLSFIFYIDPSSTAIIGFIMIAGFLTAKKIFKKKIETWGLVKQSLYSSRLSKINDTFNSFVEIKLLNKIQKTEKEYLIMNSTYYDQIIKYNTIQTFPRFIVEILAIISFGAVIMTMTYKNYDLATIFNVLAVLAASSLRLMPSFNKMYGALNALTFCASSIKLIHSELNEGDKIFLKKESKINKNQTKEIEFTKNIQLSNVSFRYFKQQKFLIKNCNLMIPKGSVVGLKGDTGSGKSTLIKIIIGLIQPSEGSVYVDNKEINKKEEIKNYNIEHWYKKISYVPQSIYLFNDSIRNNISFELDKNEKLNKKEFNQNEKLFQNSINISLLRSFINELKEEEYTIVGENGIKISGGQKQRIGIARALYLNRDILILDEATNALDHNTEKKLLENIKNSKKNLTIILISHKLENYTICDKVYNIKDGVLQLN
jgi:ABC-type multidrug transport system fused ATPase/permease subunit